MDMAMEAMDMDTMATMARGRLRLPLMPLPAMDMVMDMAMDMVMVMDMAMEAMDITDTMARGRLRLPLLLSLAMDMVMDTMKMKMKRRHLSLQGLKSASLGGSQLNS